MEYSYVGKRIVKLLSILLTLSCFCAFCFEDNLLEAHADATINIKAGDVLHIKDGTWEEEFIVLNPNKTNTGKDGTFVIKKDFTEKIEFNYFNLDYYYDYELDEYNAHANEWENSTAQEWCVGYYEKLPQNLKNAVIGIKTNETESGWLWAGVNNIDGTRSGSKDKAFFLSYREYDTYKNYITPAGGTWFLRSPYACGDLHVYVCAVMENGSVHDFGTTNPTLLGARPALNIDINKLSEQDSVTLKVKSAEADSSVNPKPSADSNSPKFREVVDPKLPVVAIKRLSKSKKSFTASWKKLSKAKRKRIDGIELQLSTNKGFASGSKICKVSKTKSSKRVKKLKSKKTYWSRVRTYKSIGGVKYVSKWSKAKKVKVR